MTMAPHQQRVIEEKQELDERASKLAAFLTSTTKPVLSSGELSRLRIQRAIMDAYSTVLGERIEAF